MTELTLSIIVQLLTVAGIIGGGGIWFLKRNEDSINKAVSSLERQISSVKSDLNEQINRVESNLLSNIANHTEKIFNLALRMPTDQTYPTGASHYGTVRQNSPLTLSVKGVEGAKKLDAESVAERLAKSISLPPEVSEFRIQEACHRSIFSTWRSLFNDEEIRRIEEHVYQDGGNLADTLIIYVIVTRNYILKERVFDVPEYETEASEDKE